jgi:hypothetical protein
MAMGVCLPDRSRRGIAKKCQVPVAVIRQSLLTITEYLLAFHFPKSSLATNTHRSSSTEILIDYLIDYMIN